MSHPHKSTLKPELFFHIREPHTSKNGKSFKAATVFARQENVEDQWRLTIVRCSDTDNFCRSTGRTMARRWWFQIMDNAGFDTWKKEEGVRIRSTDDKPTYDDAVALYKAI